MTKRFKNPTFSTTILTTLMALILIVSVNAQEKQEKKIDTKKLYAEIAGEYEFDFGEGTMVVAFTVEKDKLYAAPAGESPVEMTPVEGKELKFNVNAPTGQVYELTFSRDDKGKITKCSVYTEGMEFDGVRIEKKKE